MEKLTERLIVISLDGLSTLDFEYISELPNFKEFLKQASYCKQVYSVYPSVTYPAHATIVTGKYPKNHGIINNTLFQPGRTSPDWYWQRKYIKGDTIYDLAIDRGMKVAALLWPVTGKSRIQYNMPEIFANRPWKNQVMVSLMNGSPLYQIRMNRSFGHLRRGLKQPYLDDFVHKALLSTLVDKRPDLTLVHYVDLDSMRHFHGFNSNEAKAALQRHDKRIGEIVETLRDNDMYDNSTIIILGDHSSLDENRIIKLNVLLKDKGYIRLDESGRIIDFQAVLKSCDGSAYIYLKNKSDTRLAEEIYSLIQAFNKEYNCIEAIYSAEQAAELGADPDCTLMLEANREFYFNEGFFGEIIAEVKPDEVGKVPHTTRATHGYSPFKEDYTTVFIASGKSINNGIEVPEMSLVDEAPTMAKILGFELKDIDGRIVEQFFK